MRKYGILTYVLMLVGCGGNSSNDSADHDLVYISDNSIQCEYQGDPPEITANILIEAGIDVLESSCGHLTGISAPTVCGGSSTGINLHKIRQENVDDASTLGFRSVSEIENEVDKGYQIVEC